jgi:hypothetical protein
LIALKLLNSNVSLLSSLVSEAKVLAQNSNTNQFGIHFEKTRAILFENSFREEKMGNIVLSFNPNTLISSLKEPTDIIFKKSGENQGGTIVVSLSAWPHMEKIITIQKSGVVSTN